MGNLKNLATGTVMTAPSPATTGTSLVLQTGEGARMPATPFYAIAHPDGSYPTLDNAEIIQVTNVSSDTLTIVRHQLSTSAQSIATTWRVSNPFLKEDYDALQPLDADLTTIAGLTATTDSFLQAKASAWTTRTVAQVKTDLGLTGTNSGDQTITLTGDVTGTGTGSFATTLAAGSASNLNSGTLPAGRMPALTGDVTTSAGGVATAIGAGKVTNAMLDTSAGGIGAAGASWSPTYTAFSLGNGTLNYAKFIKIGKEVQFRLKITLGSTSSVTGLIQFTAPATMTSDFAVSTIDILNTTTFFYDLSALTPYQGNAFATSTSVIGLRALHTDGTRGNNEVSSGTNPFTWATGDVILCSGSVEIA